MKSGKVFITLMDVLAVKKPVIGIPIWLIWPGAYILERILDKPPITTQQLIMLREDNICDITEMQQVFNLNLMPLGDALRSFLPPE